MTKSETKAQLLLQVHFNGWYYISRNLLSSGTNIQGHGFDVGRSQRRNGLYGMFGMIASVRVPYTF